MAHLKERYIVEDKLFAMVTWVSRFYGIAPVRFEKSRSNTIISISRLWLIFGFLFTITFYIAYICCLINELDDAFYSDKTTTKSITFILKFSCFNVTLLQIIRGVFYGANRMKNFLYCFDQIQKIIKRFHNELSSKKCHFYLFIFTFWILHIWLLGVLDIWFNSEWNQLNNYFFYSAFITLTLMEFQFIVLAMSINSALKGLNKTLQEVLTKIHLESETDKTEPKNFFNSVDLKIPVSSINIAIDLIGMTDQLYPDITIIQRIKIAQKIRQITHSFVATSDAFRKLNSSESVILFLHIVIFSFSLTLTAYNLLHIFHNNDPSSKDNLMKILQIIWLAYHITRTLFLVEFCYRTQPELSNTRFLVGRIMCYIKSEVDPLRDEIDDFFKQLTLNNLSYSAMGICNIGRPLLSTIIGSVTTVLILSYEF